MKILMIHISDLHVKDSTYIKKDKIVKLVSAVSKYNDLDSVFLICTGDFVDRGQVNAYPIVGKAIGSLLYHLGEKFNKFIYFLPVPGNHDISGTQYKEEELNIIDKNLSNPITGQKMLYNELSKQKSYFEFIKAHRWPGEQYDDVCLKKYDIGKSGFIVNARLINTAPFSLLEHRDKEMHYISPNSISMFDNSGDLNITIMHHSPEWLHESVKTEVDRAIVKNTDILFLGHEHLQKAQVIFENGTKTIISRGGIFDLEELDKTSYFNVLVYNSDERKVSFQTFSWDINDKFYYPSGSEVSEKLSLKYAYNVSEEYVEDLHKDTKMSISKSLLDYYVIPNLRDNENGEILKFKTIKDLRKVVDEHKYVSFSAGNDLGKTSLLKNLYCEYIQEKFVVFLKSEDFSNINIQKVIKSAIIEQYKDSNIYSKFSQFPISEKIVIIDDFDKIKNDEVKYQLIKYLKTIFSIIILSTDNGAIDLKQKFQDEHSLELFSFTILPLTTSKRKQFIGNIININNKNEKVEEVTTFIEKRLSSIFNVKMVGNTFLLNYIYQNTLNYGSYYDTGENNINVVFETTLRNQIISNTSGKDVQTYFRLLELIAIFMHSEKKEFVSLIELSDLISKYREEYEEKVNTSSFIDVMIRCKIFISNGEDSFTFANRMYLAYFVAKQICFEINSFGNYDSFQLILKNICFGINGDILLFIVYILQNIKIVSYIYDMADNISKKWESLSFENDNIKCFTTINKSQDVSLIKNEEKTRINEKKESKEIENIEKYNISCHGLYDYDEKQLLLENNQIMCLHKCILLLARSLPSFSSILTGDLKHTIAFSLYDFTDKLLYRLIKPLDEEFDDFCTYLNVDGDKEDLKKIKMKLSRFLLHFITIVHNDVARLAVSSNSLPILVHECKNTICTNRLMKLAFLNNYNNEEKFINELEMFLKDYHKPYVMTLLKYIVIKHMLENSLDYRQEQRIQTLLLNNSNHRMLINKRAIMLSKIKQNIKS